MANRISISTLVSNRKRFECNNSRNSVMSCRPAGIGWNFERRKKLDFIRVVVVYFRPRLHAVCDIPRTRRLKKDRKIAHSTSPLSLVGRGNQIHDSFLTGTFRPAIFYSPLLSLSFCCLLLTSCSGTLRQLQTVSLGRKNKILIHPAFPIRLAVLAKSR